MYDDEGCEMKAGFKETKDALKEALKHRERSETYLKVLIMNWKDNHDDFIEWKKIIREEFGLVI
jgi:hypothetical protein